MALSLWLLVKAKGLYLVAVNYIVIGCGKLCLTLVCIENDADLVFRGEIHEISDIIQSVIFFQGYHARQ